MHNLMVFLDGREAPLVLAYDSKNAAVNAQKASWDQPHPLADDHGRLISVILDKITITMITDSDKENLMQADAALEQARVNADLQLRANSDPRLRGPSIATPNGRGFQI